MDNYYEYFVNKGNHPDKREILKLETNFIFESFAPSDAYQIAEFIIGKMNEEGKSVGVRINYKDVIIFQYLMNDKFESCLDWLSRKERVVQKFGHSSFYIFLDSMDNYTKYQEIINDKTYAVCGGSFPIIVNNEMMGSITVSGLRPHEDHQLIIEALNSYFLDNNYCR